MVDSELIPRAFRIRAGPVASLVESVGPALLLCCLVQALPCQPGHGLYLVRRDLFPNANGDQLRGTAVQVDDVVVLPTGNGAVLAPESVDRCRVIFLGGQRATVRD